MKQNTKDGFKIAGMSIGSIIVGIILLFALGAVGLAFKAYYYPRSQAIERDVYENTPSFVQGKIMDLAKYKREYDAAAGKITDQDAIRAIINQQFAYFDSNKVKDPALRAFLVQMRGF